MWNEDCRIPPPPPKICVSILCDFNLTVYFKKRSHCNAGVYSFTPNNTERRCSFLTRDQPKPHKSQSKERRSQGSDRQTRQKGSPLRQNNFTHIHRGHSDRALDHSGNGNYRLACMQHRVDEIHRGRIPRPWSAVRWTLEEWKVTSLLNLPGHKARTENRTKQSGERTR